MFSTSKVVDENVKKELLKVLLGVYMREKCVLRNTSLDVTDGSRRDSNPDRAAHLLNAQAVNLDVKDVRELIVSTAG